MNQQTIIFGIIGVFILYRVFQRVRRMASWQQLKPGKMRIISGIFLIIGFIFMLPAVSHPVSLISDMVGIVLGATLAYYSARMTSFEPRQSGWHYRPNAWIGGLVTTLFLGRLIYRIYNMFAIGSADGMQGAISYSAKFQAVLNSSNGWTSGLLLIMFAYYVVYNLMVSRKYKHLLQPAA